MIGKNIRYGDLNNSRELKILLNSLEIVKNKGKELWNPCDIINAIYTGTTGFLVNDTSEDCLTFYTKKEYEITIFWIWTTYVKGGDVINKYFDEVKELARSLNCKEIRFCSKRRGYEKRIQKINGTLYQVEYKVQL